MGSVTTLTEQQIGDLVRVAIPGARVSVGGDGYHVDVAVVSDAFFGLRGGLKVTFQKRMVIVFLRAFHVL